MPHVPEIPFLKASNKKTGRQVKKRATMRKQRLYMSMFQAATPLCMKAIIIQAMQATPHKMFHPGHQFSFWAKVGFSGGGTWATLMRFSASSFVRHEAFSARGLNMTIIIQTTRNPTAIMAKL